MPFNSLEEAAEIGPAQIANARLIAAAPKLLRELKGAAMFLEHVPSEVLEQISNELDCDLAAEHILGAIAGAEGR